MGLMCNNKQKSPTLFLMFSLPFHCSFSPLGFSWPIFNASLYLPEEISQAPQALTKIVFAPILIAPPIFSENKPIGKVFQESKSIKKSNSNEKIVTEDQEYNPKSSQSKKSKKNQQKENRNILPNIVNQILSYLQKSNKSVSITQKIFKIYNQNPEWTVQRFYMYQKMLKNRINHYVNAQTMRIFTKTDNVETLIYNSEQQGFYNKISRILTLYFLKTQALTSTLTSRRIDKNKKRAHISAQNQLTEKLKQLYKCL